MMTTSIKEEDGKIIATLCGELDTAASAATEKALAPLFDSEAKVIVLDCKDLEYISSSGLRVLLSILKKGKAAGPRVVMRNVNDVIRDVFDLTGFIGIFEFD